MHRAACLLILVAGCDSVWGLERDPPDASTVIDDEDGDGIPDDADPCPHIVSQSKIDVDQDGVPADCDPDDSVPDTRHAFFAFNTLEPGLAVTGADPVSGGTMMFGATVDGLSTIVVRDLITDTALVDVGFEVVASAIDQGQITPYDELGVYTAHRAFSTDSLMRGDVCFFGTSMHDIAHPKPVYLEMDEDNAFQGSVQVDATLTNATGRFRMIRTPDQVDCTVFRDGMPSLPNSFDVVKLAKTGGAIAISAQRTRVRLRYIWVAYQLPP